MEGLVHYLSMNGYWPFIWPAYGVAALVLIALLIDSLRMLRANERAAAALERRRPRRKPRVTIVAHGAADGATDGRNDA